MDKYIPSPKEIVQYRKFVSEFLRNPQKDDKPELTKDEYQELSELVRNGKNNFSKETLESAYHLHPANLNPPSDSNITHCASSDYLFRCSVCTDIDFGYQWYKIILDSIGGSPMFHRRSGISDLEKGFNGKNLAKIPEGDKTEYFTSSLNVVKGEEGYVCDHCRDSCFDEGGNLLD